MDRKEYRFYLDPIEHADIIEAANAISSSDTDNVKMRKFIEHIASHNASLAGKVQKLEAELSRSQAINDTLLETIKNMSLVVSPQTGQTSPQTGQTSPQTGQNNDGFEANYDELPPPDGLLD